MSTRAFLAVLRAARRQAALDLRAGIVGSSVALLVSVSAIVLAGRSTQAATEAHAAFGPMFLAGSIGTISCFITFQIASEAYVDRIGGALLRVRVLPYGPLTWAIGKTMSSVTQTLVFQGAILLGGALFVEALPLSAPQVLACLPLMVLSAVATAPLLPRGRLRPRRLQLNGLLPAHVRPHRNERFLHAHGPAPLLAAGGSADVADVLVGTLDALGTGRRSLVGGGPSLLSGARRRGPGDLDSSRLRGSLVHCAAQLPQGDHR